jgi:hypothetical protein
MKTSILRRLMALAATVSMALPLPTPAPMGTEPTESCPPGSSVGLDDYIVWIDGGGGGNADLPVRAAYPCALSRAITYRTYDITARAGEDYVGVNSGTVTLEANAASTTIRIRILAKPAGPDTTFGVLLTSGARFSDPDATVTIKRR